MRGAKASPIMETIDPVKSSFKKPFEPGRKFPVYHRERKFIMKVSAIYFSPTGTSRKGVEAIASVFGTPEVVDVTCQSAPERLFGHDEIAVFGGPVYGGRLFTGMRERIRSLRGTNTPCIVTVTYGNRDFDDALLELADLVREQGFVPIAGAALVGEHTYGAIQIGRPLEDDLIKDREFGESVLEKLNGGDFSVPQIPGNRPYRDGGNGGGFRPQTTESCVSCGLCRDNCPMGAIAGDCRTIDDEKCIACFRCIKFCPVKAKNCDNEGYNAFAGPFSEKLKEPKENTYYL